MDQATMDLAVRLAGEGEVTLREDERRLVVAALGALGAAERRAMLHERLLESYGHDARQVLRAQEDTMNAALARLGEEIPGPDLAAHERARERLGERMESAATGAAWLGVVLDFVRVIAG